MNEVGALKRVAISQSNYIPWKGYFDLIAFVDDFIIYDDVQYTRRDWRNRNKIKTPQSLQWMTVPVKSKGHYFQPIREVEIDGTEWAKRHWQSLVSNYSRAPHFREISGWVAPLYLENEHNRLSDLNRSFIEAICRYLEINTRIRSSAEFTLADGQNERLVSICEQVAATVYVSGPAARTYIDASAFSKRTIKLQWFDYFGYEPYPQLWGDFTHEVSILDLLFNCGKDAARYMRYVQNR